MTKESYSIVKRDLREMIRLLCAAFAFAPFEAVNHSSRYLFLCTILLAPPALSFLF